MAQHAFLSDDWLEAAKVIRDAHASGGDPPAHTVKMNQVVTEVPTEVSADGVVNMHMDTTGGDVEVGKGHLDEPELTVTMDYATAKAILVEGNAQAGMQAFMSGKIKVQGDMTKLMAMQQGTPDPSAEAIAKEIQDMTV